MTVNVYKNEEREEVIARVKYNHDLDTYDGHNFTCGSAGHHKGITQLSDGRFVLIHGTQWQGEHDWAEVISKDRAVQEILKSDNSDELLEKYGLKKSADKSLIAEKEE